MNENYRKSVDDVVNVLEQQLKIFTAFQELRECTICKDKMLDGYVFDGGFLYACNDTHRDKICDEYYHGIPWHELYDDEGDSYYTTWYDEHDQPTLNALYNMIEKDMN